MAIGKIIRMLSGEWRDNQQVAKESPSPVRWDGESDVSEPQAQAKLYRVVKGGVVYNRDQLLNRLAGLVN